VTAYNNLLPLTLILMISVVTFRFR